MRSISVARRQRLMALPLLMRLRCVSSAPLGDPVVPEVYWILATSSGLVATAPTSLPPASISSQEGSPSQSDVLERERVAVARVGEDLAVIGAGVAFAQEEGADARFCQDVAQLMRAISRVDVDQHQAGGGSWRAATGSTRRSCWPRYRCGHPLLEAKAGQAAGLCARRRRATGARSGGYSDGGR